jgi:hypothetical protein
MFHANYRLGTRFIGWFLGAELQEQTALNLQIERSWAFITQDVANI